MGLVILPTNASHFHSRFYTHMHTIIKYIHLNEKHYTLLSLVVIATSNLFAVLIAIQKKKKN